MPQTPADAATPVVSAFYDRFPYPGDPLQDGPPPGYNWRWCHACVISACTGEVSAPEGPLRILDAGCGTGVSTDYLAHLNPGSHILAVDISAGALEVARERLHRSGGAKVAGDLRLERRSLLELEGEGPFHYINSVGVLHHLREPERGLRALASLLRPKGLLHLFLYADGGRWEIHRVQRALQAMGVGDDAEGLRLGRSLFDVLPPDNRLRRHHEQRWALDTAADANFADMYLHPQETSYDLQRLFRFVEQADLQFAGFSNPEVWDPARLLRGELLERAMALPEPQRWALVESLDPDISHFEFFLSKGTLERNDWRDDDALLRACPRRNPCLWGWPGASLFDPDLRPITLDGDAFALLEAIEASPPGVRLREVSLGWESPRLIQAARWLWNQRLILLASTAPGGQPRSPEGSGASQAPESGKAA
jgi:SAM-dependent methyltransferase